MAPKNPFSQTVSSFHGIALPEPGMSLAGYSALIHGFDLRVPLPDRLAAISAKHHRHEKEPWSIFTPKHKPEDTLAGQLIFALKHEGVELGMLKSLFATVPASEIAEIVKSEPTGGYSRRLWFLYEWLTDQKLDIPDATAGNYVDALDEKFQYGSSPISSKRHRVRNNLPGTRNFCPLIRRTPKLEAFIGERIDLQAKKSLGAVHADILSRAAAFLLLKDSKASYAIEGERPPYNRAERWGRAIGEAGQQKLTPEELLRLQDIVIGDKRFISMGWRKEGGFIGVHDRSTNAPIPDHISARWEDAPALIEGLIEANRILADGSCDAVLAATVIAFGFVFIHPFEDGNGRIHRYLIHHVLAEKGFAPRGIVFPVSAVILEHIDEYRRTLETYSKSRLNLIEWEPTQLGNVNVLNETIDLYRYFDATRQAEFLYECVQETVEKTLPEEVAYLERHDRMKGFITEHFEMPDKLLETLIAFLRQGNGKFSKRARSKEFAKLTEKELAMLEEKFVEIFNG
jgi:Fic family protein